MRSEDYFHMLIKHGFIGYYRGRTALNNGGFRNQHPYNLPDGWISHSGLCTACDVLINFPVELLRDIDHILEYEWMVRAAEYGCFYCAQVLQRMEKVIEYNKFEITSYFPLRAKVDDRNIAFKGTYTSDGWHYWLRKVIVNTSTSDHFAISNATHRFGDTAELRKQIGSWMTTCESGHEACSFLGTVSPTRLLYVGSVDKPGILRLTEPVTPVRYLTLSYCWGKNQLVKLLRENIDHFKLAIDINTLHKTSRDAVEMTRALGLEYLWIDSLCIIQDDKTDTEQEITRMHSIYSGSVLNLLADSAIDCDGGFFGSEKSATEATAVTIVPKHFASSTSSNRRIEAYVALMDGWARTALKLGATSRRAWCVQERMLAPRMVQFTRSQAFWQCKTLIASELFPEGSLWSESSGIRDGMKDPEEPFHLYKSDAQSGSIDKIIEDLVASEQVSEHWNSFVRYYSQSALTFEEDRYSAMAGVIGRILHQKPEFTQDYIVGTWRQHLPVSLAWERLRRSNLSRIPRGRKPTWSWPALEGEVMMNGGVINHFAELITVEIYGAGPQGLLKPSAGMIIIEAPTFVVQQVSLEPPLWKATCQHCGRKMILEHGFDHVIDDKYGLDATHMKRFQVNPVKWDWDEDEPHTDKFTIVPITAREAYLFCLVLVEVSDVKRSIRYERRGLMSFCDTDGFDREDLWAEKLPCQQHKQRIEIW